MRFTCLSALLISLALSGAGCTVLVDGTLAGRTGDAGTPGEDAGMETDSGPPVGACTGMPDGLRCAPEGIVEPFVCLDEICVLSTCGDGIEDDRDGSMHDPEECDDGNSTPADGCEPDCTFSCSIDSDCDDGEFCTGIENCQSTTHTCEPGTAEADGTACTVTGTGETAACRGALCRAGACPDGVVDAGEDCDPAAPAEDDGCEDDCTFTCVADFDCADPDACNGNETCDVVTHLCVASAAPLDCDDMDPCTTDSCDIAAGCVHASVLVDADHDGEFAITASCGGTDCNDGNPLAYPGASEPCGASMDLNCDGSVGVTPTYYRDCDGDDYAASTTSSVMSCTEPAIVTGCSGGWTTRAPVTGSVDCLDTSVGANAKPSQSGWFSSTVTGLSPAYDYNCSGAATREFTSFAASGSIPRGSSSACSLLGTRCYGDQWWVASTGPACGATGTLSSCEYVPARLTFPTYPAHCSRETGSTTVRCH
jgi:cysteine-rich repeat protein